MNNKRRINKNCILSQSTMDCHIKYNKVYEKKFQKYIVINNHNPSNNTLKRPPPLKKKFRPRCWPYIFICTRKNNNKKQIVINSLGNLLVFGTVAVNK